MNSWARCELSGAVPRPQQSTAAWEALFYSILFTAFGMVIINTLIMLLGQITLWIPDPTTPHSYGSLKGQRWSMAASIVFTPLFVWLHVRDMRVHTDNFAQKHGEFRKWLTAIAIFVASLTLLCDAIYLVYRFLDGDVTARFIAKSAAFAVISSVVIYYFRQERAATTSRAGSLANVLPAGLAVLVLLLSFATIGGPAQGRKEYLDRIRLSDLRTLQREVTQCLTIKAAELPASLDPMSCANNPQSLSGYAAAITYHRLSSNWFQLCIKVSDPLRLSGLSGTLNGNTYCVKQSIKKAKQ
ncbi:DUF5671 domain-containing protein [Flexibacterium corallicola]|uniref:DUF5671 domain-containing protein n=1 Tax=Flexibacterium corallicola TaxID=3037259 RepID=UPI00286F62D0|nr:DUF5671 domain-containing protein [Pseudovibrio sp. M1P-2-3]